MILVIARLMVAPEHLDDLRRATSKVAQASLAEPGCIAYSPLESLNEPGEIAFVEEWEDIEALHAHFKEAHFIAFDRVLQPLLISDPVVMVHTVTASQQL